MAEPEKAHAEPNDTSKESQEEYQEGEDAPDFACAAPENENDDPMIIDSQLTHFSGDNEAATCGEQQQVDCCRQQSFCSSTLPLFAIVVV